MRAISIGLAMVVLAAGPKASSEKAAVMTPVNQFVDAFNKGDTKTAAAMCADQTSIIEEFPPHEWHGAGACLTWMNDYDADAKKNGITDGVVPSASPFTWTSRETALTSWSPQTTPSRRREWRSRSPRPS